MGGENVWTDSIGWAGVGGSDDKTSFVSIGLLRR